MKIQYNTQAATLAAGTEKTLFRYMAASSRKGRIASFSVGDQSVTATDQGVVIRVYQASGADGTGTSLTGVVVPLLQGTVLGTAKGDYFAEPTVGSRVLLWTGYMPTGGALSFDGSSPDSPVLDCALSSNISITATSVMARASGLPLPCSVTIEE